MTCNHSRRPTMLLAPSVLVGGILFVTGAAREAPAGARLSQTDAGEIVLSGEGTAVRRVELAAGLWTADMEVRGNADTTFGTSIADNFIVTIESAESGSTVLANEIATLWSGETPLRVGRGLMEVGPGRQIVSVDASGTWTIVFRNESGQDSSAGGAVETVAEEEDGSIRLSGSGTATRRVRLDRGIWIVAVEVRDNIDATFGTSMADNFIVTVTSVAGGSTVLANEIAARWSGEVPLRTSGGFMGVSPGVQIVSVDASGNWRIRFRRE